MIEAGKILQKRYRIEKQIGEGGMGAVYIATDERFGSTVAIKETFYSEADFGKAFKREARLLNNLRHAALPRVSDHFEDENGQFLVMEYIAGEDLSEMLAKQNSAFPLKDVLNWADQLLDALDYLHTQDVPVIHRDIKPQNLKLTSRGQIILLDFGLAKGNPTDAQHQTAAKSIFGYSRIYASLEQIQGTGTDPRSDLYSLSATLYHLMTGIPPADALTRAMAVLSNNPDTLKSAHTINSQIPETVSEVLNRAMSLNANHRPSSASAMRALLRENAQNQKVVDANKTIADTPNPTELFSQNTEVLANAIPKPTEAKTDVLETPISVPNKVETEQETSVRTRMEAVPKPIQVDVKQDKKSFAVAQSATNSKGKGGLFAGVALGSLLLVGGGLSAVYVAKPEIFGKSAANSNSNVSQNSNLNSANSAINNENSLPLASGENVSITNGNVENKTSVSTKKEATVLNNPKTAETTQKTETQQNPNVSEPNKVKETPVSPPEKKPEDTTEFVYRPTPDVRPSLTPPPLPPPGRKIPTAEEFRNMTPKQRERLKRAYENLPKEEQEKIRQEVERRKQEQPPIPPPNRRPPPYSPKPKN